MNIQSLNGTWQMKGYGSEVVTGQIPGSVYSFLLDQELMEDPYYRDNELEALKLMDQDYGFCRTFNTDIRILSCRNQVLRFDGIDTLAEIFLNGVKLGKADNFHCWWEYDVKDILKEKENLLEVKIFSPTRYIAEKEKEYHLGGAKEAMAGFPHIRKPHCMFGWDWGPRLPDAGIWQDVKLLGWDHSRITDVRIRQIHAFKGGNDVRIKVDVTQTGDSPVIITLREPQKNNRTETVCRNLKNHEEFQVPDPQLWWPNGLGDQPLYTVTVTLQDTSEETVIKRIGLRTLTMRLHDDEWGQTFAAECNGQTFFTMGADYIPEDNLWSRRSYERTRKLLGICRESHFNAIRIWGGGYYPDDYFYDLCDEYGIVVWQDMMFACANYRLTEEFIESISWEVTQQAKRLRHHASLGIWSGNNEMEMFEVLGNFDSDDQTRRDYLIQYEYIIPEILRKESPDTFYWPSSPSSGGAFVNPSDSNRGDVHYWDVWHGGVPFTEYRKFYFRYLSEFGFQSFPGMETVKSFTLPEDRNIFSRIMEMHQRNTGANGKILQYLSQTYLYPTSFETLLYASQLLQAEAICYGVEHFRRNRNDDRCMGAVYWQLNDIWPVASWASVDYYYRRKALQYYAKRFFAPVMISCEEVNEITVRGSVTAQPSPNISTAKLCVTNETWDTVKGTVVWSLCDPFSNVIREGSEEVTAAPFSSLWLEEMDFSDTEYLDNHLSYCFITEDGEKISEGSVLFTAPKHYHFKDPELKIDMDPDKKTVTITAGTYAKSVELYSDEGYVEFTDNYFDMEAGTRTVQIIEGSGLTLKARSVYDIR
ncbi:MAG: glycoside hydrolase family 2 protein [Solobacterium sp.]|nr:glycoside hydrolase family 2 protein [Solobacterium sp.]